MKIEFYTPEGQTIPTDMRLKVDDRFDVYYGRMENYFGYWFQLFTHQEGMNPQLAEEIVDEIVRRMVSQSYDHGAQWRETERHVEIDGWGGILVSVAFRMRDAG